MAPQSSGLQRSYDAIAEEYAQRLYNELTHKPFDRKMLDWLVEKAPSGGLICDMGCGPGQIAAYIMHQGEHACGIDVSLGMVVQAQRLNPDVPFQQGDMLALKSVPDDAYHGIAAFYSLIHIPLPQLPQALTELHRVLVPGGILLATYHIGDETRHFDAFMGSAVDMDFYFFQTPIMRQHMEHAGFVIEEAIERDPYRDDVEVQTRRGYIFARKPKA
ncbi:class I SAM-dependent methyltransferase [Phototrophicus methaneseepsis]|uniref:Class I SAM-dependent methyltransferase n=1 Tax=Phototrophicus methaneseepsis TaxID=2710758 RepID=A0A7S8E960_9CHLR|nr:class I SAM-dependent methyltransferase [Phototrophicus methaneseepsis]QPC82672.1 class I SAM-dependent methyltransferase [Phototrophicus methaneseepsis]